MDSLVVQYIIIAVVFIVAVLYLAKRLLPSKKPANGCGKGCGCEAAGAERL